MAIVVERGTVTESNLVNVRSRVSWGAIMAGATIALAVYFLFNLLGVAIGITVSGDVDRTNLTTGAAIWSFVGLIFALFFGGWVSTQCTIGENRTEAVLYGVLVWAVTSTLLVLLASHGLRLGYQQALAAETAEDATDAPGFAERINQAGREVGLEDKAIKNFQKALRRDRQDNAADTERVRKTASAASWWAFGGTMLSMIAAIAGALFGPYEVVLHRTKYVGVSTGPTVPTDRM
jgi:hypothetical protein